MAPVSHVAARTGFRKNSVFALTIGLCAAIFFLTPAKASAQTLSDRVAQRNQSGGPKKRLIVEAKEVVYDNDKNRVSAVGDATLYYDGRILQADRVIYDRNTSRVYAEGNAKMTEANGTVFYGDRFELTDDFKDGFVDSVRMVSLQNQRISAARAERTDGETTVFDKGIFTSCLPCKDNPERPPLWQVRAARIIHKNEERTVYYESAYLEFFGFPVAWLPFFSAPDPTVKRRTGFLAPYYINSPSLGKGVRIPFFWAITPSTDITFSPAFLSNQGVLMNAEWRQRFEYGRYNIRASGIFQNEKDIYLLPPFGAGGRAFRGSLETEGFYNINKNWRVGWDLAASTDKFFYQNYRIRSESFALNYLSLKESVSQIYLTGLTPSAYFDLRGYYFRGLTFSDWQKQQPVVHPVLDYNRRFQVPNIGGELSVTANVTSLSRAAPHFTEIPPFPTPGAPTRLIFAPFHVRSAAVTSNSGTYDGCAVYSPRSCLLRGIGGTYTRASLDISWRRQYIDAIGQVWTPFISLRGDVAWKDIDTSKYQGSPGGYSSSIQSGFIDTGNNFVGRAMPAIGLEYRFPFVAQTSWATHIIEPIAQIIARPNETGIRKLPNEDAQSFIFDTTTLFNSNKFSGFDRTEGGIRANVGAQYTAAFSGGGYANLMFGQSFQIAGRNSFAQHDLVNTSIDSGLNRIRSDYVAGATFTTSASFSVTARARFSEETLKLKRIDIAALKTFTFENSNWLRFFSVGALYTRIEPQPSLGYDLRREGMSLSASVGLPKNFYATASVLLDLDRFKLDRQLNSFNPVAFPFLLKDTPARLATASLGFGYVDECTNFTLNYSRSYAENASGSRGRTHVYMLRLELKQLGEVRYRKNEVVTPGVPRNTNPTF